jgi:uncharacterized membrane protein
MSSPFALAYYADVTIDVLATGEVSIQGQTNHPTLLEEGSQAYTSKKGSYWLLNVSKEDIFERGIVRIRLPKGSEVNYLKAPSFSRFTQEEDKLVLVSTIEQQPFLFLVQYQIRPLTTTSSWFWFLLAGGFLLLLGVLMTLFFRKKRAKQTIDFSSLPSRQRMIMKLLVKHNGRLTQAELEKTTQLPKSSLSRNTDALQRQGFIEKIPVGMTTLIKLKK